MDLTALLSLFTNALTDYSREKTDSLAAEVLEIVGCMIRETKVDTLGTTNTVHPQNVDMALQTMRHLQLAHISNGDGFDQAHRCDMLHTAWTLARFYLKDVAEIHKHEIALAKATLEEIAEQVNEGDALNYIRQQKPMLFMNETWNHGLWRSYYARIAKNPNAQPNEYPTTTELT